MSNIEIRKRYLVQFGKAPGNEWYSSSIEEAKKDLERLQHVQLILGVYEVVEAVKGGEILKRIDRKLDLLQ